MQEMFNEATSFNQDLSNWCVSNITSEPSNFSTNSALSSSNKPLWGKEFTIALSSGSQAQTVTATTAITPIQYSVSSICSGTISIGASNLPTGVAAALNNNVATISGTPVATATGTFNYSLTVSGSTSGQTVTGTIIVLAGATPSSTCSITGSLTSANGSDSQTVSMSTVITNIEYTLSTTCSDSLNAAIAWTPSAPNGVSMSYSNNVATISGTPTGTATGTYNYTLTASNTAGTASVTFSGSLTVGTGGTISGTLEFNNSDDVNFVGVGVGGTILTSDDGITWSTRNSGVTENLSGVAYGLNRFIAVGSGGTILSSTDGKNWTVKSSGITTHLEKVTFGNNKFVAVGSYNVILTSDDGNNWSKVNESPNSIDVFSGISYGNGVFVASPAGASVNSAQSKFYVSTDTTNWTGTDSPPQQLASNVGQSYFMWDSEFGSNGFISIGLKNGILHSTDNGQNYSIINHQFNNQNDNLFSIAFGDSKYVAVGRPGVIISSSNGTNWTTQTSGYEVQSSGSTGLMAVTYGENKYVVFGNRGGNDPGVICLTSSDAINWTSELISTGSYDVYDLIHKSVPYSGNQSTVSNTSNTCSITGSLTSAVGSDSQTVSMSTAITSIEYTLTTTCSDTLNAAIAWTPSTPNGVTMSFSNNVATISGTPTGTATGTYNYTLTSSNTAGTVSTTFSGSLEIVESPKTYTISVTASSSSDYTLVGNDRTGGFSATDPSVTLNVGDTINFAVDASGHPFYLKTAQGTGTGDLISGVTNNGATNGTVSWTPSATGTYYYQCSLHNGMNGTITVNE